MRSVEFHPAALAGLDAATDWYLSRSTTAAAEFVRETDHAMERIAESHFAIRSLVSGAAVLSC